MLIHHIDRYNDNLDGLWANKSFTGPPLFEFTSTSAEEVLEIVMKTASTCKSRRLDPMPTNILKTYIENDLPIMIESCEQITNQRCFSR